MTPKQQRFVDEYLIDLNATQAAIRAGYSENSAAEQGYANIRKPQIAAAIAEKRSDRAATSWLSVEWVLAELLEVYRLALAIRQPSAATAALVKLGEHAGMWPKTISVYDYREQAQRAADALGIDVEEVLIEAKRLTEGK